MCTTLARHSLNSLRYQELDELRPLLLDMTADDPFARPDMAEALRRLDELMSNDKVWLRGRIWMTTFLICYALRSLAMLLSKCTHSSYFFHSLLFLSLPYEFFVYAIIDRSYSFWMFILKSMTRLMIAPSSWSLIGLIRLDLDRSIGLVQDVLELE
ncbi:hypothetical protein EDD18DRAFT_1167240 [Armillaria luteobubalina]|uniref:Uncharacterized protein n=1 Tax=Armillaria luteobubalina TaxID=153913 RepID=A0AA39Q6D1_9AGAR|nr:hypothetical protein EDD18DRAFT_1167240 [Armillaria luteobubalina]